MLYFQRKLKLDFLARLDAVYFTHMVKFAQNTHTNMLKYAQNTHAHAHGKMCSKHTHTRGKICSIFRNCTIYKLCEQSRLAKKYDQTQVSTLEHASSYLRGS